MCYLRFLCFPFPLRLQTNKHIFSNKQPKSTLENYVNKCEAECKNKCEAECKDKTPENKDQIRFNEGQYNLGKQAE